MGTPENTALSELTATLPELMVRDEHRLRRRLDAARRGAPASRTAALAQLATEVDAARRRVERRRAAVPAVRYPAELPISQRRDDLAAAIRDHQVVIVAGETGSGKTTQLPKICLELGRGVRGMIGHTQPRRLAARTVADRIAEELGTPLGGAVGYQVRFTDRVGEDTLIKLMTDGILLAEIQHDRSLARYDTLIIDEAHERSLNVDFLLGYLRHLLPRRPDLKVIITSATIDPERFSQAFGGAPIVEVSGRTYPVELRYRPVVDPDDPDADPDRDQVQAICDAVGELTRAGPGDILVFCSGEREIRDAADALAGLALPATEVVPLYARLSAAEQHRVFQPHGGRRIVLATNVAETSLTVPGVRYVVDPGTARISRFSHRLKVQRLPIEPISQASANQRAGRCGRTSNGICIRLYPEADYAGRAPFTDPEILRTNLASVILRMAALGLGDVAEFPFIDGPDRRAISSGVQLLVELGALAATGPSSTHRLLPLGRRLAELPLDPRLGRMVLAATELGCVHEVMVIAAALSIQDPRERPVERRDAADALHARFTAPDSDFLTYLNLWRYLAERQEALSSSQFRKLCRAEFLNYLRVREWQDLYGQLRRTVSQTPDVTVSQTPGETVAADAQRIHTALLAGLLSHIGMKDAAKQDYQGARGARFAAFPGSALFRKQPRWVMAAELVETSRLWGRVLARIEPEWVEPLADHLVKRDYSQPHWEKDQGAVMAYEKVTLYGLPLAVGRKVNYARHDPELCRELFIRHALVEGDWSTRHEFFRANQELLSEVAELEHRSRRRDIVIDDETLFDLYDQRIGAEVVSGRHFDTWWKRVRREQPDLLTFDRSMLTNAPAGGVSADDYPDEWGHGELPLRLTYQFEPGAEADGVTVHVPVPLLGQLSAAPFSWQVPGLRDELVTALIRSLPKPLRHSFVPVPDHARAVLTRLTPGPVAPDAAPLPVTLARELRALTGVDVPPDAWRLDRVPDHLKVTFRAVDDAGRTLAEDRDLTVLARRLAPQVRATLAAAGAGLERRGVLGWDLGTLPRRVQDRRAGHLVTAYPALVEEPDGVAVRMFETEAQQRVAMWRGTRRLLLLAAPSPAKLTAGRLTNEAKLTLLRNPHGSVPALLDDCASAAVDALLAEAGGPAWDEAGFAAVRDAVRARLGTVLLEILEQVRLVLAAAHRVGARLADLPTAPAFGAAAEDVRGQLAGLVYPGFVTATGRQRLPELVRYLAAAERRLDKLPDQPHRDQRWQQQVDEMLTAYQELRRRRSIEFGRTDPELAEIRWMIEELRVSYFAQTLGTPYPVSDKRITRAMERLTH
ncbi:MAG: ATP-dependent RNA helicase HrpA [Actinobacteria bacterium]|nr:ATP-dependent RNA helicase HrpA [Actinomycetota bacterium]MBI3687945.1 ATP-dependent RNA helicase HrpA [Actinomycetota bacterium]